MSDRPNEQLLGRDHTEVGELALVARNRTAIALSRGGAPKRYQYAEPNEDAVGFADGPGGWLLAVADGHDGAACAAIAVASVLEGFGPQLLSAAAPARSDADWEQLTYQALRAANKAVIDERLRSPEPVGDTTLSLALVRPHDGRLVHASVGDSHVFVVSSAGAGDVGWQSLGRARCHFLGFPEASEDRENSAIGCVPLADVRAVVLATDGLSEEGIGVASPAGVVGDQCRLALASETDPDLRAVMLCRSISEAALEAHRENNAGDNLGVAALIL